jgi:D-inositol-3-phosphate glycosyltransferase
MTRHRILAVGQAVQPTGYARVMISILERLCRSPEFELLQFAFNYRGVEITDPWRIEPNRLLGDPYGREQMPGLLREFRPDLVYMCHDPWLWNIHAGAMAEAPGSPKSVFYCPVDWAVSRPEQFAGLESVDQLVAYTEFGRRTLDGLLSAYNPARSGGLRRPIAVIPLGVDLNRFYPLSEPRPGERPASRSAARALLFPELPGVEDAFIVLNANRPSRRKRVDLTLQGFAEFVRNKADAWLLLHIGRRDWYPNVMDDARRLGIDGRLLLSRPSEGGADIADDHLNLVYNACDVGLNTAAGEGWGLVAFEHAATGAAQVVPDHGACSELWREAGILIPTSPGSGPEPAPLSTSIVAGLLDQLYEDREFLASKSAQAFEWARSGRFSWDEIADVWRKQFLNLLGE